MPSRKFRNGPEKDNYFPATVIALAYLPTTTTTTTTTTTLLLLLLLLLPPLRRARRVTKTTTTPTATATATTTTTNNNKNNYLGLYNNPARRIYGRSKHSEGDSTLGL